MIYKNDDCMTNMPNVHDVGFMIKLIHDDIDRLLNESLKPMDMTASQGGVLAFLYDRGNEPTDIRTVQEFMGIAHPTVCGLVRRLAEKGFIRVEVDPKDRRARFLYMTDKARSMFRPPADYGNTVEKRLLRGLSQSETDELRRLLKVLHENVK